MLCGRVADEPSMSLSAPPPRASRWFALSMLTLGSLGVAAAWVLLAFAHDRQESWMAVVAAIDAAAMLRLSRAPSGWTRAACGVVATAVAIALANWGIAAAQIGKLVGLLPWESLLRLGPAHAWTLISLANPAPQQAWLLFALIVAAVASR